MTRFLFQIQLSLVFLFLLQSVCVGQEVSAEKQINRKENVALRTAYAKYFLNPDGETKMRISPRPVHYKDEKRNWQDITCAIQSASEEGYIAQNTSNTIASYFPGDVRNGVKIKSAEGEINIGAAPALHVLSSDGDFLFRLQEGKQAKVETAGNTVTYKDLFANASNAYTVDPNQLKNNLILESFPTDVPAGNLLLAYAEQVQLPAGWALSGSTGKIEQEVLLTGGISIVNDMGKEVFSIPVPDVFELNNPSVGVHNDGNWKYTYKVKVTGQGRYEISTLVPTEWLRDPARNYPVVIDPTVTVSGNYGGWQNTLSSYQDGNPTTFVFAGLNTNGGIYNSYVRFDISSIPTGASVSDTRVQLQVNGSGNTTITETVFINDVTEAYGPYGAYNEDVYNDLGDGAYTSFACTGTGSYGFFDLGTSADNDVMKRICTGSGSFQVGMSITGAATWKRFTSSLCVLEVTYTENSDVVVSSPTYPNGFNIGCFGESTGSISATGDPSYSYAWTGPDGFTSDQEDLTDLAAGTYYVTATNTSGGCVKETSIELTEPGELMINGTLSSYPGGTNVSCNGANDGSITLNVTGGSGYTYAWTDLGTYTSDQQSPSGLTAGTYSVTVTEGGNSCEASESFILTEPAALNPVISQNGDILSSTSADEYQWLLDGNDIDGEINQEYTPDASGSYSVTVTDSYGCSATSASFDFVISNVMPMETAASFLIYPNPASSKVVINLSNPVYNSLLTIQDSKGKIVERASLNGSTYEVNIESFAAGVYFVKIDTGKNIHIEKMIVK